MVPEVVAACTSESSACERADDSHGHWASCTPGLTPDDAGYAVEDDCHYYSFMYFRSDAALDTGDAVNATYRKIMVVEMTEEDEELGLNITAGIMLLPNRSRLSELQSGEATEVGSGFEAAFEAASVDAGVVSDGSCAQIAVYDASAIDSELSTDDATVFNEESAPEPLCISVCSKESGKMLEVKCKKEDLGEVRQKDARRRLAEGTPARPPRPNRRRTIRRRPMRRRPMRRPRPRTHPSESSKPWAPVVSQGSPSAASSACSSSSASGSCSCAAPTPRIQRSGWGRPRASKRSDGAELACMCMQPPFFNKTA